MIGQAREFNQQGARVKYHHNPRPDLSLFAGTRSILSSVFITLQPYRAGLRATTTSRVRPRLPAGGAILFQMPAVIPRGDPPERLRFSFWPPTLWMRLRRYTRYHLKPAFPARPGDGDACPAEEESARLLGALGRTLLQAWTDGASAPTSRAIAISRLNGPNPTFAGAGRRGTSRRPGAGAG